MAHTYHIGLIIWLASYERVLSQPVDCMDALVTIRPDGAS
jgi:hypothetical protein